MIRRSINRSALLLLLSGILIAVSMVFHPGMNAVSGGRWITVHVLLGIAALLGIFGLAGLYSPMRVKMSRFGQAAFGAAILGNVLMAGLMFFINAGLLPVLAGNPLYQPLLSEGSPLMSGFLGFAVAASIVIAVVGWVMLAGYLVGTKTITGVNGLLFLGVVLMFFSPPLPLAVGMIGGILFGGALVWLGVSLKRGTAHDALQEVIRLEDECLIQAGGHA